jgi:hypothetical protein
LEPEDAIEPTSDSPSIIIEAVRVAGWSPSTRCQQVGERHLEAITHVHTQHQRAWPLVRPQAHVAGREARAAAAARLDVPLERVDHAARQEDVQAIEEDHLIEGHDVRHERPRAGGGARRDVRLVADGERLLGHEHARRVRRRTRP